MTQKSKIKTNTNRLAQEASLYLQQHQTNPVDWYPWGPEALEIAKRENKPILLSIGYSACHWCHVMAAESFVDPETAKLMNELFINIKVDREQRPDLDKVYQATHQLLTGRGGGWPLTVFLNPQNLMPFFAGTYFPLHPGGGLLTFKEVLQKVATFYAANGKTIDEQNARLSEALTQLAQSPVATAGELIAKPLVQARQQLAGDFDPIHGGFGNAPKFPQPVAIERLLRWWQLSKNQERKDMAAWDMVQATLEQMAKGGIYDQIGGGFYRYCVDEAWQIPHFEKMLYDNGQLLGLYAKAVAITRHPLFMQVVEQTAAWAMREMRAPHGGFYATLDADSEHHEGKFYYWTRDEIKNLLTPEEYAIAQTYYGLNRAPNFEDHWHLHLAQDISKLAYKLQTEITNVEQQLATIRQKLFTAREQRVRPGRDEKIITAWNGLMIQGLALAGQYLNREDLITAAQQALDFILENLWLDGRLYANYQQGKPQSLAYLDDYAFLLDGILSLLQVRWRQQDLQFAIALADNLLTYFEDKTQGGFFFTASDHEQLIQRPKPLLDEAIPAGNGVVAKALARLGHLLGEPRYLQASEKTLQMAWSAINAYPIGHNSLLTALEENLYPPQIIILRGEGPELLKWQKVCQSQYAARRMVFVIPSNEPDLPGVLSEYKSEPNKVIAYCCIGHQCLAPIDDFATLEQMLASLY